MRTAIPATLLATIVALTACGGSRSAPPAEPPGPPPPPFFRPTVELQDVRLAGAGLTGGSMELVLGVYNPNDYALQYPRVAYRVLVDSIQIGSGLTDLDVIVPAEDSATVRLPLSFSYRSLGRAGQSMVGSGSVNYRVRGNVTVGTPHGALTFPFDRAGWFSPLRVALPR